MLARLRQRPIVALADIAAALHALDVRRRLEEDADGPRRCCASWAYVTACTEEIDHWRCACCGRVFQAPCLPVAG